MICKKNKLKYLIICLFLFSAFMTLNVSVFAVNTADETIFTWGSQGDSIKSVQDKLKRWGYYTGNIDGVYNYRTMEAVKAFQRKSGLTDSGNINVQTLEALGIYEEGMKDGSTIDLYENDIWLLASLIEREAKNEDYITKVSFGAMVINRTKHPAFPDDISGVIYETDTFGISGEISENPSAESLEAARDAVQGFDPVNGAVYYWQAGNQEDYTIPVTRTSGSYYFGWQ